MEHFIEWYESIGLIGQVLFAASCMLAGFFVSVIFNRKQDGSYDYENPTVLHGQTSQTPHEQASRVAAHLKTKNITHYDPSEFSVESPDYYVNVKQFDKDPTTK